MDAEKAMTTGSEEWFREESEKAAGPESPLWAPVFEKALRRVWDAACEECAKECDSRKHIFPGGAPDWQHGCEACAEDCRAKQVKP